MGNSNNMDMKMLMNLISKMDKKQLEEGLNKVRANFKLWWER